MDPASSPLDDEQRALVDRICADVLDLDPAARREAVRAASNGDAAVEREVLSILDVVDRTDDEAFLATPVVPERMANDAATGFGAARPHESSRDAAAIPDELPERIGRYEILAEIGRGGMGIVYEARQDNPSRTVALKVLRGGLPTREIVKRFEREIRLLGRLQHPGIAQIYEAGTADVGGTAIPYFAMELVRGKPLLEFANDHELGIRDRLRLIAEVCSAVQFAHQRGVLHRDLKPANILVETAETDDTFGAASTPRPDSRSHSTRLRRLGRTKVLDFGVGRALADDDDRDSLSVETAVGAIIGTLPYMSPEQVSGRNRDLDTRSDVYALGVVTYELLAGELPYSLKGRSLAEAARIIEEDAPRSLGTHRMELRGDLETVVAKALEKLPERRYRSAAELADDLHRFLDHEPVQARPASAMYQLRVFARRHRGLMAGLGLAFVTLLIGLVASLLLLVDANRARDEAERKNREARIINDFLNLDLLASADPEIIPASEDITVREVLDAASDKIAARFGDLPLAEAVIRGTLGVTYRNLGDLDAAIEHLEESLALLSSLGDDHPDVLARTNDLAWAYTLAGRTEDAVALLESLLDRSSRALGPLDPLTLSIRNNLASTLDDAGEIEACEAHYLACLDDMLETLGEGSPERIAAMGNYARLLSRAGRLEEAARIGTEAHDLAKRHLGDESVKTLSITSKLGTIHVKRGDLTSALPMYEETLRLRRAILGDEHPDTLTSMNNLAILYKRQRRFDEATPLLEATYEIRKRKLGERHPVTLVSLNNLATERTRQGLHDQARELHREALRLRTEELGDDHPDTQISRVNLAQSYRVDGQPAKAEPLYREAYETQCSTIGASHPDALAALFGLATSIADQGRDTEALTMYESLLREIEEGSEVNPILIARYRTGLGSCLTRLGRAHEALEGLRAARAQLEARLGPDHPLTSAAVEAVEAAVSASREKNREISDH